MSDDTIGFLSMLAGIGVAAVFWMSALRVLFNGPKLLRQQAEILARLAALEARTPRADPGSEHAT